MMSNTTSEAPFHLRFGQRGTCDVLVFGAHPDDAEMMCGGAILKMCSAGKKVAIVDCNEGELSTNGNVELRRQETLAASTILGISQRLNLGLRDGYLNRTPELVDALVVALRLIAPKLVIGPPNPCRHPDHQALHLALKEAHFFCGLKKYLPENPHIVRPKLIHYVEVAETAPSFLVDISEVWEKRCQAILAYASQFDGVKGDKTFINDGLLERLELRYRHYGEKIGCSHAEPFLSDVPPKVDLLADLG